jgi:phosphatidylinositol alpha-1,6-mannosyltransferase
MQLPPRQSRIAYTLSALRLLGGRRGQLVFCGHVYLAALAAFIARITGSKLVVQMHGIEAWPRPGRLRRYAVEKADLVLCVSRYTRAAVLDWASIAPERVIVVPNTVAEDFTPDDGATLRAELGLAGKQILLTVSRMDSRERYKGHDRVIAAMPQLIAAGHDVVYVIVGEGDDRARLEAVVAEAGMAAHVLFAGALERERLIEAYRMADLYVMPSTGEGFGIAFLEAMACGTPALGLNVAGAIDALADGELGSAVPEADFPATISRLLAEQAPDRRMLAAAVQRRFGRDVFAENLHAAILPLLGEAA